MTTITCTYQEHAKRNSEKIAIYTEHEEVSYKDWERRVCKTANWLTSTLCKEERVGILLPNGVPFLQLFAGASAAGLIAIPLDVKWKPNELSERLLLARPSIVVTTKALARPLYV